MTQVKIIGAGVAGLTAGIYARKAGFDVEILEKHDKPGGFCSSWWRDGHRIEGGLHWLTGSAADSGLYPLWKEVGALPEGARVHLRDPFTVYYYQGREVRLYRDLEKLEAHFLELAPEDGKAIRQFVRDVKKLMAVAMPVQDIKGLTVENSAAAKGSDMLKMLPSLRRLQQLTKISLAEYLSAFRHEGIRGALASLVPYGYAASAALITLATLARGDGGYVEGGSTAMAEGMAQRFSDLGGRLRYKTPVEQVWHEFGRCHGVVAGGGREACDAVVVTQDALSAINDLFIPPLRVEWMEGLRENCRPQLCDFVALAVEEDLSHWPESLVFPLPQPYSHIGMQIGYFSCNNYAAYPGYAPPGCTTLTCALILDSYDFWKQAKEQGRYRQEKAALGEKLVAALESVQPQLKGKVRVLDVTTPLSYQRYCGSYHGSWMSYMLPGAPQTIYPQTVSTISRLYFAGQRLVVPGGLPVALSTGRTAAQHICKEFGKTFVGP